MSSFLLPYKGMSESFFYFRRGFFYLLLSFITLVQQSARSDSIAFLYALDADLNELKAGESAGVRSFQSGGTNIQEFQVGPHKVRATKMGAGNIETAINTANLLGRFPADLAISLGPSGSLTDKLDVGSWYRIDKVIGYQRGTVSAVGWVQSSGAELEVELPPLLSNASNPFVKELPAIKIASGDAFVANDSERERIRTSFDTDAVDMNSFGFVLVCQQTRTPAMIWKVASDRANSKAGEDFKAFIKEYDGEGGRMVRQFLMALPPSPMSPESYENIRELMQ